MFVFMFGWLGYFIVCVGGCWLLWICFGFVSRGGSLYCVILSVYEVKLCRKWILLRLFVVWDWWFWYFVIMRVWD